MALDILTLLIKAPSIMTFVEESGYDALFFTELNAARNALSKASLARDPNAQVWNCISHLESAESNIERRLKYLPLKAIYNHPKLELDVYKLSYIKAFMATCYKYLNENELMESKLTELNSDAKDYFARLDFITTDYENLTPGEAFKLFFNPVSWVEMLYLQVQQISHIVNPAAWKSATIDRLRANALLFDHKAYIEELRSKRRE